MRLTTITYKRLRNLGDFNNETLEATAILDEDEDPTQASDQLRQWVNAQVGISEDLQELRNQQVYLEHEVNRLEELMLSASQRWDKIKQFLDKLGVGIEQLQIKDDIPF